MKPQLGPYRDIPDFIYGITRELWEDRGVGGRIGRYHAPSCLVRAATGVTADNAGVTAQTPATLHQFPDRQLVGEDVIFLDHGDGSFLSSHRLISVMRHQGSGSYGAATNRLGPFRRTDRGAGARDGHEPCAHGRWPRHDGVGADRRGVDLEADPGASAGRARGLTGLRPRAPHLS